MFEEGEKDVSTLTTDVLSTNTHYTPSLRERDEILILDRPSRNGTISPQSTILFPRYVPQIQDSKTLRPGWCQPNNRLICHGCYKYGIIMPECTAS